MYRYLLTLELNRGASRRGERPRQQRTRVVFEIIPDSTRFDEIPYGAGLYIRPRELQTFHRQLHPLAVPSYTTNTLPTSISSPFNVHQSLHSSYLSLNQNPRLALSLLLSTIPVRPDTIVNTFDANYVGRTRSRPQGTGQGQSQP